MRGLDTFLRTYKLHLFLFIPPAIMALMVIFDPPSRKTIMDYSAWGALSFFIITTCLGPLKALFPQWTHIIKMHRYRRYLGITCFLYASVHLGCFVMKRIAGGFLKEMVYFVSPAIIPTFWVGFPILLILAVTSNQYWVKRLSFPRWKRLHRLVYVAEAAIAAHLFLLGKLTFLLGLIPLIILQGARIIKRIRGYL